MKNDRNALPVLLASLCLLFVSCTSDIEYVESQEPQSITVLDITNNLIPVYTAETFQVKASILPENAKVNNTPTFEYISDDTNVFTVSSTGLITGVTTGEAILYVKSVEYPNLTAIVLVKITDRYYDVTEIEIAAEYKNFTMLLGDVVDLSFYITVKPDNASNPALIFESSNDEVVTVSEIGVMKALTIGSSIIKIKPADGSGVAIECTITVKTASYPSFDRSDWTVITSTETNYGYVADKTSDNRVTGMPEDMFDDDAATFLSLVKPGKSYNPVPTQSADFMPSFTVDMKISQTFDFIKWRHRQGNSYNYLRVFGVDISGSNDGTNFSLINLTGTVWIPNSGGYTESISLPDLTDYNIRIQESTYRYIKITFVMWSDIYNSHHTDYLGTGAKLGSTMQVAEFYTGKTQIN